MMTRTEISGAIAEDVAILWHEMRIISYLFGENSLLYWLVNCFFDRFRASSARCFNDKSPVVPMLKCSSEYKISSQNAITHTCHRLYLRNFSNNE